MVVHGFIFKMSGIFKNNFNNLPEINGTPQPPFHPLPPWGSFVKYVTRRFVTCVTVLSKNRDKMRKTRYDKGGGEGVKKKSKNSVTYFTNDLLCRPCHK